MKACADNQLTDPPVYRAYLVRLWRSPEQTEWRVYIRNVTTGQTRHFESLAQYLSYMNTVDSPQNKE